MFVVNMQSGVEWINVISRRWRCHVAPAVLSEVIGQWGKTSFFRMTTDFREAET
jgi:hypothetical protein